MEMILQLILAGLNLRENQNGDKNDSDQNGEQMESKAHAGNVRDESVGQGIEALVRNNDGAGFLKGTAQQAAENKHTGQCRNERGDANSCYQCALIETNAKAKHQDSQNSDPLVNSKLRHQNRGNGSREAGYIAYRKINVLQNQNQGHTDGKDCHIADLLDQIAYVGCL